ncbi:MAG: SUMF1/EgtB/PvdO family nonheme iron enzyme [Planctomycetota bacterium]
MTNPDDRFESPSDVIKTLAPFRRGADLAGLVGVRGGREPTTSPIESTRSWVLGIGASLVVIAFVWFGIDRSDRRISTDETFTNASVDAAPTSRADLASKESSPGLASLDTTTHSQAEIETERDWLAVVPFSSQQANSLQRSWSERLRVPIERIDQLGSGNELTTVLIPPGQFKMGPDPDWQWNEKNRVSQVSVDLDWFRIGKFEITCEQWDAVFRNSNFAKRPTANQELSGMPIGNVSHVQATRYCQLLTKHCRRLGALTDGWEFALPTEAQWEFACRAGTITRTSFGNNLTPRQANIRAGKNSQWKGFQYPVPVGKYPANPFGLHDMHGNQWEWCRDVFARLLIAGSDPLQQDKGDQRTLRGGSWADEPNPIRWTSANRYGRGVEQKFSGVGFRVVLTRLR